MKNLLLACLLTFVVVGLYSWGTRVVILDARAEKAQEASAHCSGSKDGSSEQCPSSSERSP